MDEIPPKHPGTSACEVPGKPPKETISLLIEDLETMEVKTLTKLPVIYHCSRCSYQTGLKRRLKKHYIRCRIGTRTCQIAKNPQQYGVQFKCEYCTYSTIKLKFLIKHKEKHASEIENGLIECSHCNITFFTMKECKIHMHSVLLRDDLKANSSTTQNKKDDNAGESEQRGVDSCKKQGELEGVKGNKAPSKGKRYRCTVCGFISGYVGHMRQHLKFSHSSEWCSRCSCSFRGLYQLLLHNYLAHREINDIGRWRLQCTLCNHMKSFKESYDHGMGHKKLKLGFRVLLKRRPVGYVTLEYIENKNTGQYEAPRILDEIIEVGEFENENNKCHECAYTARDFHLLYKHGKRIHSEMKCPVCKFLVKGKVQFFCHNYLIHGDFSDAFYWTLCCPLCPYKGRLKETYEHGKGHQTSKIFFPAFHRGSKSGTATFHYSANHRSILDALPKEIIGPNDISSIPTDNALVDSEEFQGNNCSYKCADCCFESQKSLVAKAHQMYCHVKWKVAKFVFCPEKDCSFGTAYKVNFKRHMMQVHKCDAMVWAVPVEHEQDGGCCDGLNEKHEVAKEAAIKEMLLDEPETRENDSISPETDSSSRTLKCSKCPFETEKLTVLQAHHMYSHVAWKANLLKQCPEKNCKFSTAYKNYLKRHLTLVHKFGLNEIIYEKKELGNANTQEEFVCFYHLCSYKATNENTLREHLISFHQVVGKAALERLLRKALRGKRTLSSRNTNIRLTCTLCPFDTNKYQTAIQHGRKHLYRVLVFYKYEEEEAKGLVKFTYPDTQCDLCDYRDRDIVALHTHKHVKHRNQLTETQKLQLEDKLLSNLKFLQGSDVLTSHIDAPTEVHDRDQGLLCCSNCCYKSPEQFQMKVHQVLAHNLEKGEEAYKCPEDFCCYTCEQKNVLFRHLVVGHKYGELHFRDYGMDGLNRQTMEAGDLQQYDDDDNIESKESVVSQTSSVKNGKESECSNDEEPIEKRLKVDEISYKCWICGLILPYTESLQQHTNRHAEERNDWKLRGRFTVYQGSEMLNTITFSAKKRSRK